MRRGIKNFFNAVARKAGIAASAIALAVGVSPLGGQQRLSSFPSQPTYWKMTDRDMTLKVQPCEGRGLCVSFHASNPDDPKVRELYALLSDKDADSITRQEIMAFCGYTLSTKLTRNSDGEWDGTVQNPFNPGKEYGLRITLKSDGQMELRGYKWMVVLGKSIYLDRAVAPPPACKRA